MPLPVPGRGPASLGSVSPAPPPKVSIHLPICCEPPQAVRRTLDALARLDYPEFEVLVIDSNTADPALWEPVAEHCARLGARFRFFHLGHWAGGKAGALNFSAAESAPDSGLIGVLHSGWVVRPDWLRALAPLFAGTTVGLVQSPCRVPDAAPGPLPWSAPDGGSIGRDSDAGNAILRQGGLTLLRREALSRAGGWAEWTTAAEAELSLRLARQGWRWVCTSAAFGTAPRPPDEARRAQAAAAICRRHWRALLLPGNRELTAAQRRQFLAAWLPWFGEAFAAALWLTALIGLTLAPQPGWLPITLLLLSLALLGARFSERVRHPCDPADHIGKTIAGMAVRGSIVRAMWGGLLAPTTPGRPSPGTGVLLHREWLLPGVSWTILGGLGLTGGLGTTAAAEWSALLLVQSLPYLAAAAVAAFQAGRRIGWRSATRGLWLLGRCINRLSALWAGRADLSGARRRETDRHQPRESARFQAANPPSM